MLTAGQTVKFPEPNREGKVSLERCIWLRRSIRGFRNKALGSRELGQLLWAAQGVTGPDGGRAVPSAGALYPLELYVAVGKVGSLASGTYHSAHELVLIAPGHPREKLADAARGQDWLATAPAIICVAAVFDRSTGKYGRRGCGYIYIEAGHAAESLMLQAVALGLGATMVGAFSDDEVKRLLHIGPDETPLCLIPVGTP